EGARVAAAGARHGRRSRHAAARRSNDGASGQYRTLAARCDGAVRRGTRGEDVHPACASRATAGHGRMMRVVRQRGFTLLEILLALALLAFVMLGVWGAMRGAARVTHSANAVMAQGEAVRTVQQFLRRYVGAAGPQPFVTADGSAARMFRGDGTSMEYVAPLPMQSGHAGLYIQTVSLQKDGAGMSLRLAYQPYA